MSTCIYNQDLLGGELSARVSMESAFTDAQRKLENGDEEVSVWLMGVEVTVDFRNDEVYVMV